ncbi:MAG: hypothetical protein C4584_00310 [Armatimonadetes bacterium]|nr:MAG: hypothetical protein C4584_00310 [Armatimonadota bacterium]
MWVKYLLLLLLILSLFLEGILFSLPLVFILSLVILVFYPEKKIYFFVFVVGFFLDSLRVVNPGITSLMVFSFYFIFQIYQNIFEVKDYKLLILLVFVSSLIYGKFSDYYVSLPWYIANVGAVMFLAHFVSLKLVGRSGGKGPGVFLRDQRSNIKDQRQV